MFGFLTGDFVNDEFFSTAEPRNTLFMAHRLSPELRFGRKTGGCSLSVASSNDGPT